MSSDTPILEVDELQVYFSTRLGDAKAVDGVSFSIERGQTLGLVGESGSGKSVTARAIIRLVPIPPGRYAGGTIHFDGENLLEVSEDQIRSIRGNRIGMIFQDPMTFLNPVYTAGEQVAEAIRLHKGASRGEAKAQTIDLFKLVGIPSAEERFTSYPHQLSGGMRQRVMIAMALSSNPELLVADEPTTALDVTIQAQILDLLRDLQEKLGMSILLITHDLGVVAEMCDNVAVMYAGQIVERAPVRELFNRPEHPYTVGLLAAVPGSDYAGNGPEPIPGSPPDLVRTPTGCRFNPRCWMAEDICRTDEPASIQIGPQHWSRCHFAGTGKVTTASRVDSLASGSSS